MDYPKCIVEFQVGHAKRAKRGQNGVFFAAEMQHSNWST
jgi:hypothetical protein